MLSKLWQSRARGGVGLVLTAGAVALAASPALAGSFYRWTTEDGVVSYTDDAKRIPARYRDRAEERTSQSLAEYDRFTPVTSEGRAAGERQTARLESLRAATPAVSAGPMVVGVSNGSPNTLSLNVQDLELGIPCNEGDEPVVVEQIRTKPDGANATRTIQVVRQGRRILAVVKPFPNESQPDGIDERDVLGD